MSLISQQDQNSDSPEAGTEPISIKKKLPILKNWKTILISCLASMFEFYDFGVLGFFAYEIGQALFPPNLTEMQYNIWVYGLFWAGFSTRPFGGALFGHISDTYGRKKAFRLSIITMALCTFATGCIPSYAVIGIAAPIILLILRLIQGLSTGGEISAVFVYLYEIAPKKKRAFWMSLMVISSVGALLATLVKITIDHTLTDEQILLFGWRIPFWFGIFLLFIGWYSKFALKRTPVFESMIQQQNNNKNKNNDDNDDDDDDDDDNVNDIRTESWFTLSGFVRHQHDDEDKSVSKNPFTIACCNNTGITIIFIMSTGLNHLIPYLHNVFLPDYLSSEAMHGWSDKKAYQFNAYLMLLGSVVIVVVGILTDKYGPLRFLMVSGVLTMIMSPFIWYLFTLTSEPWQDFCLFLPVIIIPNITCGAVYFWYIDVLLPDPTTRTTIFGVAYNIGAVLFAGTAPFLGSFFIQIGGLKLGAVLTGCWVSLCSLICIFAYLYATHCLTMYYDKYNMNNVIQEEQQELTASEQRELNGVHQNYDSNVEHDYVDKLDQ